MFNPFFLRLWLASGIVEQMDVSQLEALDRFKMKLKNGIYCFEKAQCLCGATKGDLVARYDRYGLPVKTHLCRKCGVLWTSPRMTAEGLNRFYTEDYRPIYVGSEEAPEEFFREQSVHGEAVAAFLEKILGTLHGKTVFDVGCGAGGVLAAFVRRGCTTFGCDLNPAYLRKGRENGLQLEEGSLEALAPYAPADIIIFSHVLEHSPDPRTILRQAREYLQEGGAIYVELPGVLMIREIYKNTRLYFQNAHLYHFSMGTLSRLLATEGFNRMAGDERIHALFRMESPAGQAYTGSSGDYRAIRSYLTKLEAELPFKWLQKRRRAVWIGIMRTIRALFGDRLVNGLKVLLGRKL